MTKKIKKILILIMFLLIGSIASVAYAAGWSLPTYVTGIRVYDSSNNQIMLTGFALTSPCDETGIIFKYGDSDPDVILDMALTSFASGRPIACYVDGCYNVNINGNLVSFQKGLRCRLYD